MRSQSVRVFSGADGRRLVAFGVVLSAIVNLDRVALAVSRGRIASGLHLNDAAMGIVFSAYSTAYAFCEIPSGFLGDRFGPRPVLLRIAVWWAAFMAATGMAFSFASLYASQLLFGAGEAGCYPNIGRLFGRLPAEERPRAQGAIWLSARFAGAFTPVLMAAMFRYLDWRQAFAALSVLGGLWAVLFRTMSVAGAESGEVSPGERPWGMLARSGTMWLLCGQYLALVFPWFFLITWAPTFIDERFALGAGQAAWLKALPLFFGGLGALTSGFIAAPRKPVACIGFAGAGAGLAIAAHLRSPVPAVLAIAMSSFCNDLVMPVAWGTAAEVGGQWSATVSAAMNMAGNAGGALYGVVAGLILRQTHHNWNAVLYMGAAVYACGIPIWLAIDPYRRVDRSLRG